VRNAHVLAVGAGPQTLEVGSTSVTAMNLQAAAPTDRPRDRRWPALLVALTFLLGLYLPTSYDGVVQRPFTYLNSATLLAICACLLLRPNGFGSRLAVANAVFINLALVVGTLVSPAHDLVYGVLADYLLLSLVYCLNLRGVASPRVLRGAFILANLLNVAIGVGIVFAVPAVTTFVVDFYSNFYPALVRSAAVDLGKPILTFSTHSLAGFFLYLFFYLNLRSHRAGGHFFFLLAACVNLALCGLLKSNTGYVFLVIGSAQLVAHGMRRGLPSLLMLTLAGGVLALWLSTDALAWSDLQATVSTTIGSQSNGVLGRYGTTGEQNVNLEFLARHPLTPFGFSLDPRLEIVDSGPIEYVLRGSLPLLLSMYGGLWLFLHSNVLSRREAWTLFVVFVIFEVGFANLVYFRTAFILPFVVVYMNVLQERSPAVAKAKRVATPSGSLTAASASSASGMRLDSNL
jgi:hypothetical protein